MDRKYFYKSLPLVLALSLTLSGCGGEKSKCDIPSSHVHKFVKEFSDDLFIERFVDSEYLTLNGYKWCNDYLETNKFDEQVYKLLNTKRLFDGESNWDYLFNEMASYHDYLMFCYEYYVNETYTTTDSEGNVEVKTRRVKKYDWHDNPYSLDNTGEVRFYHHRFSGYRVVRKNNKFVLEKSPYADDIREIIYEYPYFSESPVTEVYTTYYYSPFELGSLKVEDFDDYKSPDLECEDLYDMSIRKLK